MFYYMNIWNRKKHIDSDVSDVKYSKKEDSYVLIVALWKKEYLLENKPMRCKKIVNESKKCELYLGFFYTNLIKKL